MTIYESGNAAKQSIFLALEGLAKERPLRILDLACGNGRLWSKFLQTHSHVNVVGIDTSEEAIRDGQEHHAHPNLTLCVFDAQKPRQDDPFDVVVCFSAVEHVVDRVAFLRTVWGALAPKGYAYLNYDVGHFRSHNLKERIMVPVSQLLALVGVEGPYMKKVDDVLLVEQAKRQGFVIIACHKHNLHPLKGFFRGATDEAIETWVAFEERLNTLYPPADLDSIMMSTTLIVQKL